MNIMNDCRVCGRSVRTTVNDKVQIDSPEYQAIKMLGASPITPNGDHFVARFFLLLGSKSYSEIIKAMHDNGLVAVVGTIGYLRDYTGKMSLAMDMKIYPM